MSNWHKILEIAQDATQAEIKAAYRKKAASFHPDVCDDPDASKKFIAAHEAYLILTDPSYKPYTPPPQPKPKPKPKPKPRPAPRREVDLWGEPQHKWIDSMTGLYYGEEVPKVYTPPAPRYKPRPEPEVDIWKSVPNPMAGYWKEYNRLKAETAYEEPEVFWNKLDEWLAKNGTKR